MSTKKKVFVGLSGGVDSSVAAFLLQKQNYEVVGVYIRCYNLDGCSERDAEDARRVASHLNIPFYVFDFEKEYKDAVVNYMIDGYKKGLTPNPDVMCNKEIKFGLFLNESLKMGADYIATGHYVKLRKNNRNLKIFAARDATKDQSYFLWTLSQNQLKHCLFPIGSCLKTEVRQLAKAARLPTAEKKDSQGICFLGKISIEDFLKNYIPEKRGDILTPTKEKIGEHRGVHFYTIGQRHIGSNLNLKHTAGNTRPHYIAKKDISTNTLTLAEADEPSLLVKEIAITDVNFISRPSKKQLECLARLRYRQPLQRAILKQEPNAENWQLIFENPQKFPAAGQSAVFYKKNGELLGGGVIL